MRRSSRLQERIRNTTNTKTDTNDVYHYKSLVEVNQESCETMRQSMTLRHPLGDCNGRRVAIFLAGPAGAGKSYIYNYLQLPQLNYAYYNVDTYYEHLLWKNNIIKMDENKRYSSNMKAKLLDLVGEMKKELQYSMKRKDETDLEAYASKQLASIRGKLMAKAKECMDEDYQTIVDTCANVVIDKPGNVASTLLAMKRDLDERGYETYMIVVYAPLDTVVERDSQRYRQLGKTTITKIWQGVMKNLTKYKKEFGDDKFFVINNSNERIESLNGVKFTTKEHLRNQIQGVAN